MLVVPHLGLPDCGFFNPQPQRLLLALAGVTPAGTEGELAFSIFDAVGGKQAVINLALVDHVEAEQAIGGERCMGAGDARLQPLNAAAVMDGIEKAGQQVHRRTEGETAHALQREARLWAAHGSLVQHWLINIQPGTAVAGIAEMAYMGPSTAGQIQVTSTAVAKQLLQPVDTVALRLIVESAHIRS